MKSKLFVFVFFFLSAATLKAEKMPNPEIKKYFVILASSQDYENAKATAEKSSQDLKIKLDLRGLNPDKKSGLSFDKKTCLEGPTQEFPCYNQRGKFDDGEYISIEYSNSYKEMKPGLYIVVAFSGEKKLAGTELKKIKRTHQDAYLKEIKVYMAGE
ncbi:MAG: hypothetical protein ACAH59_04355 [Pseudobdellovibrionaceae bacterium]